MFLTIFSSLNNFIDLKNLFVRKLNDAYKAAMTVTHFFSTRSLSFKAGWKAQEAAYMTAPNDRAHKVHCPDQDTSEKF